MKRGIVIVGFMGAGKTTTGRELARQLGRTLIDLDEIIVTRAGRSIAEIIDADGEPGFREIEATALAEALGQNWNGVIALGGGTWTSAENRAAIKAAEVVSVWLDAPFPLCWRRIGAAKETRPLARDEAAAARLHEERISAYAQADVRIDCASGGAPGTIVAAILAELNGLERIPSGR